MKSYSNMLTERQQSLDSKSRKYLSECLSEYSRSHVLNQLRQRTYTSTFRSMEEKAVVEHCINLLVNEVPL